MYDREIVNICRVVTVFVPGSLVENSTTLGLQSCIWGHDPFTVVFGSAQGGEEY